jgi:broad specificity phosphatase PhoE
VRLILARHGRTAANVAKALDSRPPGMPLDDVGRGQAARLAERLADEPVTAVYASPAVRAQETAAAVGAAHGLAVTVLDDVREASCGDLEGKSDEPSRAQFRGVYQAWLRGEFAARVPGGDSALDVIARFVPAVEAVTATATDAVVVVSHGAAIRLGAAAMLGGIGKTQDVANIGVVVLTGGPGAWTLEHWDAEHAVAGDVTGGGAASF